MDREELKAELAKLKETIKWYMDQNDPKYSEDITEISKSILSVESQLQSLKNFNKKRFLDNYKALLGKTGVKVSQIEAEADVAQGYLSRLGKEGNTSDPGIEYICSCAKLFDVSLDYLLNGTVEEMTQTETFIADFADSLIIDTMNDEINWNEEPNYDGLLLDEWPGEHFSHPLYYVGDTTDAFGNFVEPRIIYGSRYDGNIRVSVQHPSFSAMLPNTNDKIYFMNCDLNGGGLCEIYLLTGKEVNPICNTQNICETVRGKLRTLYSEIRKSGKRVHISTSAVNSISNYLKRRK